MRVFRLLFLIAFIEFFGEEVGAADGVDDLSVGVALQRLADDREDSQDEGEVAVGYLFHAMPVPSQLSHSSQYPPFSGSRSMAFSYASRLQGM